MNAAAVTKYSKPKRGIAAYFVRMATYHVRQRGKEMALLCQKAFIFLDMSVTKALAIKFLKLPHGSGEQRGGHHKKVSLMFSKARLDP